MLNQIYKFLIVTFVVTNFFCLHHTYAQDVGAQGEGVGIRLIIKQGNQDVTGRTVNVFAGQKIMLSGSVTNGTLVEIPSWDVPGGDDDRVANWSPSDQSATITPLTVLNQTNVSFYFLKKGMSTITLKASVAGNPLEALVKFNVLKPDFSLITGQGKVWARRTLADPDAGFETGKSLGYGDFYAIAPDLPVGIGFVATFDNGIYGGNVQFVQTVDSSTATYTSPGGQFKRTLLNIGLDRYYPYDSYPADGGIQTNDSPIDAVDEDVTAYSREASYTMYLMWQPPGNNSIFVSLAKVKWGWSGTASEHNGVWQFDSGSGSPVQQSNTDELPQWTTNAYPANYYVQKLQ